MINLTFLGFFVLFLKATKLADLLATVLRSDREF